MTTADVAITAGCGDTRPRLSGHRYLDWPVEDSDGLDLTAERLIRDDIERRVRGLLDELAAAAHA